MKICPECGFHNAQSNKRCENCGRKLKKSSAAIWVLLIATLFGAFVIATNQDTPTAVPDAPTTTTPLLPETPPSATEPPVTEAPTTEPAKQTSFGIGETAELKNVQATLIAITETPGNMVLTPADGNIFLVCEVEIVNNTKSNIAVSSLISFTLYCDDYACNLSIGAITSLEGKTQLDGEIAPGKKMRGIVGYEVPANWKELELHYSPDAFSSKAIVFVATND